MKIPQKCCNCDKECPPLPQYIRWSVYLPLELFGYEGHICRRCFADLVKRYIRTKKGNSNE